MRSRAELALVFNALVWGATFVVVKDALRDITPLLFLALRFSLATLALLLLFRGRWKHARNRRTGIRGGAICGVFLFAGYVFQTFGLQLTTAPKSAFITGLSTVLVPLLAMLVYKTRPRIAELGGVTLALAGLSLMTLEGPALLAIEKGDLLTAICAVGFAAHIVTLGHYSQEGSFEWLSVTQLGTPAVLALSLFWWAEAPSFSWGPAVWGAIALTGLLATALAFTIQSWAQQYTTATRTALILTLEPLFAWGTSWVLTGETLSGRGIGGAALILAGILLVEMKPPQQQRHPSE